MFIPYRTDIDVTEVPTSNLLIIAFNIFMFVAVWSGVASFDSFILDGAGFGLVSYGFMHAGFFHLLGNMFYLWIFGNAICFCVGSATYPPIFLLLIVLSGIAHLVFDGAPAIGASGAVNGVIGIYLYLYPRSNIRCMWTLIWVWGEKFTVRAYWLIGFWFLKDLYGAINSDAPIAYAAHIGGLLAGLLIGWQLDRHNWIKRDSDEANLIQVLKGH